jgi:RNA polymerase sigma-70 factor (ECF subfamily)
MSDAPETENLGGYPNTQWTLVIEAMQSEDGNKALAALEVFCEQYRDVICGFFRRRIGPDLADDYTQEFFLRKIHKKWDDREGLLFNVKRKPGGKFRYVLVPALRHFLIDMGRAKRDPMKNAVPDAPEGSTKIDEDGIQQDCDREVALGIIRRILNRLQISDTYLRYFSNQISAVEGAHELGLSEGAFRVAAHRLKPQIKRAFQEEVRTLVAADEDLADEIRYLMRIFVNSGNAGA